MESRRTVKGLSQLDPGGVLKNSHEIEAEALRTIDIDNLVGSFFSRADVTYNPQGSAIGASFYYDVTKGVYEIGVAADVAALKAYVSGSTPSGSLAKASGDIDLTPFTGVAGASDAPVTGLVFDELVVRSFKALVSCLKSREHTSGKLLAWTKCMMLKDQFTVMSLAMKACTWAIKKKHPDWADVFEVCFPNETHPIRKLAQKRYL